jgi:hypothetical protein
LNLRINAGRFPPAETIKMTVVGAYLLN